MEFDPTAWWIPAVGIGLLSLYVVYLMIEDMKWVKPPGIAAAESEALWRAENQAQVSERQWHDANREHVAARNSAPAPAAEAGAAQETDISSTPGDANEGPVQEKRKRSLWRFWWVVAAPLVGAALTIYYDI